MRGSPKFPLKESILLIVLATLMLPLAAGDSAGGAPVLAPTGPGFESNKCFDCHSDSSQVDDTSAADEWVGSIHDENGIGCERCHSASVPAGRLAAFGSFESSYRADHIDLILTPDINYKAPSAFEIEGSEGQYSNVVLGGLSKAQEMAVCARCHGLTPLNVDENKAVFQDYITSVHGQSIAVGGLGDPARVGQSETDFEVTGNLDSAVCTDCHNPHATLTKDDPDSETFKDNVPKLCGTDNCHNSDDIAEKYGIVNAYSTFEDTHHGKALGLGVEGVPICIDCHVTEAGTHRILAKTDPSSPVHPNNVAESCANEDCHGLDFNVGSGSMHGKDADSTIGKLISLFYKILIPLVIGFFALYILLDFTLLLGKKGGE